MNIQEIITDLQTRFAALKSDIQVSHDQDSVTVHVMGYFTPDELFDVCAVMKHHNLVARMEDTYDGENGLILYQAI